MKKVIITGASGLFGSYLTKVFDTEYKVVPLLGRKDLDITDTQKVMTYFKNEKPDLIIHSAGFRMVDEAEKIREKVLTINTFGTKNVALSASQLDIPLIHISSDSVFDGNTKQSYSEYDPTHPINAYGYSKMMAEQEVMRYHRKHFIVRVPLLFGTLGNPQNNSLNIMIEKLSKNEVMEFTTDQICSPTYCKDAADAILKMAKTDFYGLYHISNQGKASRYEFYKKCAELLNLSTDNMMPILQKNRLAQRPKNTVFSSIAFKNTFNLELRDWNEALTECILEFNISRRNNNVQS